MNLRQTVSPASLCQSLFSMALTLLLACLLLAGPIYALDEASAIPEQNAKVLNSLITEFGIKEISPANRAKLYGTLDYAFKGDWYSYWTGNGDLKRSKTDGNSIKVVDLIVVNSNRTHAFTYVYFPLERQIFYSTKQFVETDSDTVLSNHAKLKDDKGYKKLRETDNYAFYQKEGFLDFTIFHVKAPNGGISYIDYGVIDLE